jgi:probable F420-dependent oxidoreductase
MAETSHDPFLPLVVAAERTKRMELVTSIAVAFARNPMILASLANDLQAYSKGRFILGLGSQIKPHIEKRFSMPWSHPAARMREMIQALHAIWATWEEGAPLNFRGEYYTHTLMTPAFSPE